MRGVAGPGARATSTTSAPSAHQCRDADDKLYARLCSSRRLRRPAAGPDRRARRSLAALVVDGQAGGSGPPSFKVGNVGRSGAWPDVKEVRARLRRGRGGARRASRDQVAGDCARRLGVGHPGLHPGGGRRAPGRGPARVPRPAGARPRAAPRPRAGRRCAPAPPRALPAAAPRRVPGHRPDPDRAGRADRRRRSRRSGDRRRAWTRSRGTGPPVRRRRPEAVDLPVPPRRHRHVPGRPGPLRYRAAAAWSS